MQKSDKKSVYIPYFNNIEITSIKIFAETPEISGKSEDFFYNRNYSKCLVSLIVFCFLSYVKILIGIKREFEGTLFDYNNLKVIVVDTTYREVYLG